MWRSFLVFRPGPLTPRSMRWPIRWFLVATLVGCEGYTDEQAPGSEQPTVVSAANYPVRLIDAGRRNMKLTEPGDVAIAEAYLAELQAG